MSRFSNAPAGVWHCAWDYAGLCENATKPYAPGQQITAYEAMHGKPFDIRRIKPFGCYVLPFVKSGRRKTGKNADRAKPGIFVGYRHSEGYSACLILDPKTRRTQKVPFEQCNFFVVEFPWRNPKGQSWPPLEITDTADEFNVPEEDEVMCAEEAEPYIREGPRTRARAAAETAQQQVAEDLAKKQEEQPAVAPAPEAEAAAEIPALDDEASAALLGGSSVYFDEASAIFCGFAATGASTTLKYCQTPRPGLRR